MKRSDFDTFLAVARLRNFRKAAEHLNTTQSNVSARVAGLERRLGVQLFERQPRAVALTRAGRDLAPYAEQALAAMEAFEAAAGTPASETGTLRLAMSETLVGYLFGRFIEAFSARFPNVAVEVVVDSTTNQRQQLLDQTVDLAFLMGPVSEYEVTNLPLASLPLVWAAAPEHPAARDGHLRVEDLAAHTVVSYARISRPYAELSAALNDAGVARPRLFASNALSASLALTLNGSCLATLPEIFARPYAQAGRLRLLSADIALGNLDFTASFLNRAPARVVREAAGVARDVAQALQAEASD